MSEINPTAVIKLQIGDTKPAVIPGKSMEFTWDGTRLGVRVQGDPSFQFVDIKGQKGDNLEYKWDGTKLGVRIQGQTNYSFVDLEGPTNEPFRLEMEQMLSSATGSATAAAGSASAANSSKVAAATSATSAATSATNASGSATSAATSAGAAATSATSAARSANESAESATSAQNSKSAAESARSSAAGSATSAATSATAAAGSATVASNAASSANTSKETALSAQTAAAGSANAANTHATIAQNARSGAETAQAGASNYSGFAQASATEAEKSKVAAAGSATAASNSATAAATSAGAAATSAGAAATSATAAETARSETAGLRLDVLNLTNFAYVENLYPNSAAGITTKAADVIITPNAAIAPDGGSAFKMVEGTANAEKIIYFNIAKPAQKQEITFSLFLKPLERSIIAFWLMGGAYTATRRFRIDLITGNITQMSASASADTPVASKASVIPVGDGWVRLSFTYITPPDTTVMGRLDMFGVTSASTYVGDGTSGILFYGPQFSYTKGPIPYLETVGQAMPKTYIKVLADSTLGGSNPSPLLPPSQKSAQDFANTKVPIARPISLASTNLTLAVLDASKFIPVDSPSAVAVTVPTNTAVAIPIGSEIVIMQKGNGPVSIAPSFGVNVLNKLGRYRTKAKGDTLTLRKIDTNDWVLTGDVTYPLDNVSAHSAWSIRRLSSTYIGPALRVRRSSDNAETDIYYDFADQVSGFSGVGAVNGPRLVDWAAGSTMFVKTIYNQGTSGIPFTNNTAAEQPQLLLTGGQNPLIAARIRFIQDASRLLAGTTSSFSFMHQGEGATLILRYTDIGTEQGQYRGILQNATGNNQLGFTLQKHTNNRPQFAVFNGGASSAFNQAATNDGQGWKRLVVRHGSANTPQWRISEEGLFLWSNSGAYTSLGTGTGPAVWVLALGSYTLRTPEFDFDECLMFNANLSDADLALTR